MRRVAFVLLAAIFALMVTAIVRRADREPHPDETEYLHAAWLIDKGETLYVTFFEHHPPFLFAALRLVVGDDVRASYVRARLLSGAFALLALAAYAAIVWRIRAEAAAIALALIFAAPPMWLLGMTAARAEPFALAFFWCGAALILLPRNDASLLRGFGLGLVALAALWNPKWPLSTLVVLGFWWWRTPRRLVSASVAAVMAAGGIGAMALLAPLDRVWFFVVEFNRALWPYLSRTYALHVARFAPGSGGFATPGLLHPVVVIVAVAGLLGCWVAGRRRPSATQQPSNSATILFFLLLALAASLELRFVFPYPMLWNHYYLMWAFACAALVALIPASLEVLLKREKIAVLATAVLILVIAFHLVALAPVGAGGDDGPYWQSVRYLQARLEPDDTVWISIKRHPVAVRDGTFYWLGFDPFAFVRTPRSAQYLAPAEHLPFCALARGGTSNVRFIGSPAFFGASPEQTRCFEELLAAGRVRRTPIPQVFEIVR